MNIALYHNLTSGGSKREAYEFAKQFVQHGHIVHLFAPKTADETFLSIGNIAQSTFNFDLNFYGNWRGRLPLLRRYVDLLVYILNLRRLDRVARIIAHQIDAGHYDWVFVHHDPIVQSPYLLRHLKTRSAYYCAEANRGVYEFSLLRSPAQSSIGARLAARWYAPADWTQYQILKAEDRKNLRQVSWLLTNSFFTAESLYRAYGVRARVVYLGVDQKLFRPLALVRQNFVLSVGAITRLKGFDFLIQALGALPATIRPALVLVGNTASIGEMNYLKSVAESYHVTVEFRVNVTEDELVRLYNQARAFVYAPILEPFGLVVLEAMACGTPVVAVKEGGVRESVVENETGWLTPREPQIFADVLSHLLSDDQLTQSMGRAGRARVESFWTWEHAYARLMQNLND